MTLEEIIANHISRSMLERVTFDQNVISAQQRADLFKASDLSNLAVAKGVVDAYGTQRAKLAYGIYQQIFTTDWDTAELLLHHFKSDAVDGQNLQASLVSRFPTVPLKDLDDFLLSVKYQVCLIVSRRGSGEPVLGTGFLVGPDLVLTCRHVLDAFPVDGDPTENGSAIEVYFDFFVGEQVNGIESILPDARKVRLAEKWHLASCPSTDPDGMLEDQMSTDDTTRVKSSLDFILLRLAEKVGLQPLQRGGGKQRGWIDASSASVPAAIQPDEWIIIPQHPNGMPQRIDFGRYRKSDPTDTRLRYNTNTAGGSSGAPCFSHSFRLVGLHNASVGPKEKPLLNQAIRASLIAPKVAPFLGTQASTAVYLPRWSVSRDGETPRVILGREKLLDWIRASATTDAQALASRVYAAHSEVSSAGCSFSLDILHAEIRGTATPRVVYGKVGQQLPTTVEDFLHSLLRELGVALSAGESIPPRPKAPGADPSSINTGEVDKLGRWISQQLPEWLGDTIEAHLKIQIDIRPQVRSAIQVLQRQNQKVPPEMIEAAESLTERLVRLIPWDYAYVVIDDLRSFKYAGTGPRTELQGEVRDLIAALVRSKTEATIHPGLRRLRWMFLGYLPDFLPTSTEEGGITPEVLEPSSVGKNEIIAIFNRMSQAYVPIEADLPFRTLLAKQLLRTAEGHAELARLVALQNEVSQTADDFLKEATN